MGAPENKEATYKAVVSGLREIGHTALAEVIEIEQFLLYGDPDAPEPIGILTDPSLINRDLIKREPDYVLRIIGDRLERARKADEKIKHARFPWEDM